MSREKDDLAGWMLDGLKAQAGGPQNPNGFWRLFWMCALNGSDKAFKELQDRSRPDMIELAEKNQGGELEWFCPESIKQALNGKEKAAERFVALALSKEWKPFFWGMGKENGFGKSLAGKAEFWPVGAFLVKALQAGWEPAMELVPMALECARRNEEFLSAIRKDHKAMAWNDARTLVIELLVASASSKELAAEKAPKGLEELARALAEWAKGLSEEKRDEISADLMASSLKKGRACATKAREFCPGVANEKSLAVWLLPVSDSDKHQKRALGWVKLGMELGMLGAPALNLLSHEDEMPWFKAGVKSLLEEMKVRSALAPGKAAGKKQRL